MQKKKRQTLRSGLKGSVLCCARIGGERIGRYADEFGPREINNLKILRGKGRAAMC